MDGICDYDQIQKNTRFLGFGHYRVTENGIFLYCDAEARKMFAIPADEVDLSTYSIQNFHVVPSDREVRLKKLTKNSNPDIDVFTVRINGQYKNLFDICWCYHNTSNGQKCYVGMVAEIISSTLSQQIFEGFPFGLYEVDETDKIVYANAKMVEMLSFQNENRLLGKNLRELWDNPKELEAFNRSIEKEGIVNRVLCLKDANNSKIKVEIFSRVNGSKERFGMVTIVTQREQYYHAMENMPTGYFHIENGKITHCNDHFARILGYETKKDAIGKDTRRSFLYPDAFMQYIKDLHEADLRGEPLQNYPIKVKKANSNAIITISVDSQLVKDEQGNEIGREGTIRDITKEADLEEKVVLAEQYLKKTTEDINKLIHTFLHPVLKFSGNSELQYQMGQVLHRTVQSKIATSVGKKLDTRQLGEKLLSRMNKTREDIPDTDEPIPSLNGSVDQPSNSESWITMAELKNRLKKICYMFDHRLRSIDSYILLDDAIRDTTIHLLEELNQWDLSKNELLRVIFNHEFIEFLQNILFNNLMRGAKLLVNETEIMKQKVESLRGFLGFKKKRKYNFFNRDIGAILEKNLQQFDSVFQEKELKIDYKKSGNLLAFISASDIERIMCNLLHNAWKYSDRGPGRFIKVRAIEMGHVNHIFLSIESFGVPIKQEEIKSGKIWEVGYRGEKAYESDRDGTGVGLADCKDVIEAHGGKIEITSEPPAGKDEKREYRVSYLTKVSITIPKSMKKKPEGAADGPR